MADPGELAGGLTTAPAADGPLVEPRAPVGTSVPEIGRAHV